jgi:hypothetical protein
LFDTAGSPLTLLAGDIVRVKIGRCGKVTLDLSSAAATANGSVVTKTTLSPAQCNLRLAQADMAALQGPYDCEVLVSDSTESSPNYAAKTAAQGIIQVFGPILGGKVAGS